MLFISQDHQYAGKNGVVRAIMNNIASVYLYDDGQEIDVPTRSIEPTAPSKFDKVSYCTHSSYTVQCSDSCMYYTMYMYMHVQPDYTCTPLHVLVLRECPWDTLCLCLCMDH